MASTSGHSSSHWNQVKVFAQTSGSRVTPEPTPDLLKDQGLIRLNTDLVAEELSELHTAWEMSPGPARELEIVDALGDLEYVIHFGAIGLGCRLTDPAPVLPEGQELCPDEELRQLSQTINYLIRAYQEPEPDLSTIISLAQASLEAIYRLGDKALGYDINRAFHLIHQSNMTKFPQTEELAQETVEHYLREHQAGRSPYDQPAYRRSFNGERFIIYNQTNQKILKSLLYHPVDLHPVIESRRV
jgi:hypothetical protein